MYICYGKKISFGIGCSCNVVLLFSKLPHDECMFYIIYFCFCVHYGCLTAFMLHYYSVNAIYTLNLEQRL